MDIGPKHERDIGLYAHQAKITGCAMIELDDGTITNERREFGQRSPLTAYLGGWQNRGQVDDCQTQGSGGIGTTTRTASGYATQCFWRFVCGEGDPQVVQVQ
jgi:hypothetical protein